jgi:hypothetical protein
MAKDLTEDQVVVVQKKLTLDLFAGVIKRTPVDTGVARGGWQIGISTPATGVGSKEQGVMGDFSGPTYTMGLSKLAGLGPFAIVYITNAVSYVAVLDQGLFDPANPGPSKDPRPGRHGRVLVSGGYSIQAPAGMVDVTITSLLENP